MCQYINGKTANSLVPQTKICFLRLCSPIMADDLLHIVGYISIHGYCNKAYQIPLDAILSGTQTFTSYQTHMWNNLLAPCYNAIISKSCPPVIVGGSKKGFHTSEISVLDVPNSSWKNIALLANTKAATAVNVVPVNHDSILVIGGYTGGRGAEGALTHSIATAEKGTSRLYHSQ